MKQPKPKPKSQKILEKELDDYRERLRTHDWLYDFSEDPGVVSRGKAERTALTEIQKRIDPDKAIWNQYARN